MDISTWTVKQCWDYLDKVLGIDVNTIDWLIDDDREGWQAEVERRMEENNYLPRKCPECGDYQLREVREPYRTFVRKEDGTDIHVEIADARLIKCENCGCYTIPNETLERAEEEFKKAGYKPWVETKIRFVVVGPDGVAQFRECESNASYDSIQASLGGGWLESVPVGPNFVCYVDEDGIAKGLPRNERATKIVMAMLWKVGRIMLPGDYIKGIAVFTGSEVGRWVDLPESVIQEYFPELVA